MDFAHDDKAQHGISPHSVLVRTAVSIGAVVWILGTLVGMGWIGGPGVERQGEGLFSDSATLVAPSGPAFAIWFVIYLGLAIYVVWQWLPAAQSSEWTRLSRCQAAIALALNGLWLLAVWAGWILVSVLILLAISFSFGAMWRTLGQVEERGWFSRLIVGGTFGIYLGWSCVAVCANSAVWVVDQGVAVNITGSVIMTFAVLIAIVALVFFLLSLNPCPLLQLSFVAAVSWGLAWIAVGRLSGELINAPVGYFAAFAAVLVAGLGVVFARWGHELDPWLHRDSSH